MRRYHLFELHEQPWFPASLRELSQLTIGRGNILMGVQDSLLPPFRKLLEKTRPDGILDLCSGSGELVVDFWRKAVAALDRDRRPKLVVSDLYPNEEVYARLRENDPMVDYYPQPVDARHPPEDAPRVRTLLSSFHHFRPREARQILQDAARHADGLAIFESTRRSWVANLNVLILAPWVTAFVTAFLLRPFRIRNLVWGLLLPVIPLAVTFDALVSNLRSYTVEELEEMTSSIDAPGFEWEAGTLSVPRTVGIKSTYLLGWRSEAAPA